MREKNNGKSLKEYTKEERKQTIIIIKENILKQLVSEMVENFVVYSNGTVYVMCGKLKLLLYGPEEEGNGWV